MKTSSVHIIIFLLFAQIINVLFLVLIYVNTNTLQADGGWVNHTNEIKLELSKTMNALLNAETGQRGYLLTGDDQFLDPYVKAAPTIDDHLTRLTLLTANKPNENLYLNDLRDLAKQRLDLLQEGITVRKTQGVIAVSDFIKTHNGRQTMDQLRTVIAEMDQYESLQYQLKQEEAANSMYNLYRIALVGMATEVLLFVLAICIFYKKSPTKK